MAYFIERNVVQVHPCYSMWQNSLPFSGYIIFHGLYVIHLSIHGHLGCFWFLAVVNSVAVNTAPFPFSEVGWMMPRLKSPGRQESPPLPGWVIFNSSLLALSPALLICTVEMIVHPTGWSRGLDESVDITRHRARPQYLLLSSFHSTECEVPALLMFTVTSQPG